MSKTALLALFLILALLGSVFVLYRKNHSVALPPQSGQFCGGFANIACPTGFTCKLEGSYPDAGGTCLPQVTLHCPANGWVDCLPGPGPAKPECQPENLQRLQSQCPNFQGIAK